MKALLVVLFSFLAVHWFARLVRHALGHEFDRFTIGCGLFLAAWGHVVIVAGLLT